MKKIKDLKKHAYDAVCDAIEECQKYDFKKGVCQAYGEFVGEIDVTMEEHHGNEKDVLHSLLETLDAVCSDYTELYFNDLYDTGYYRFYYNMLCYTDYVSNH